MRDQQPDHPPESDESHAFVLRIWRSGVGAPWHASLRPVESGARIGFADAERLIAYLRRLMDDGADADDAGRVVCPPAKP